MQQSSNHQDASGLNLIDVQAFIVYWLSRQIEDTSQKQSLILDFSRACEILEFSPGDQVLESIVPIYPTETAQNEQNSQYFFLITQGRVRLLSCASDRQKQISIQLLAEGETFGNDLLFDEGALPYQAIAATPVQVVRIALEKLKLWLENKFPELKEQWLAIIQRRQALIFFKTLTELGSTSSNRLLQLLPYLQTKQIIAGTSLDTQTGHFWLRQGQIRQQSLEIGSSWGYPQTIPSDWIAQTDLFVYYLSKVDWEEAKAIAPILATQSGESSPPPLPSSSRRPLLPPPLPQLSVIEVPQEEPAVDFPKPLKRYSNFWKRYPFIEQQSAADCGATCLAMISLYWGKRLSLNWLRNLAGVSRSGAALKNLAKAAERLGYQARPVRASLNRLEEQKNPWIAHWQGDHYVVVYQIKAQRVLIADPARGKKFLSRQDFLKNWTGYALLLDPTEFLRDMPEKKRSLGRFLGLLSPYKALGVQIILVSLLIQVFGLITPLFTQIILDQVVVNKSLSTLHVFALGILIFGVWGIGLTGIRQYLLSYMANRLDLTMMSGFIRHALKLPLKFFESRHVGDIITRVSENEKIQRFLISQVVLAWLDFLMGFVYLGLMFYYNWQLTLLVVALIPPIILLTVVTTPLLRKVSREVFNQSAGQNSALVETISGMATIKSLAAEQELRWRWEELLTGFLNARFQGQKLGINLQAASGLINSIGSAALLWYGATLVIQGQLTIGQFVAFNMLIGKVLSPILALVNLWDELQEVLISVERLDDIFSAEPEESSAKPMLTLPALRGEIRLENVTFRYEVDEEQNTLQNISFAVEPGATVAIVGRSGSGKSTLIKLLQGLYQPTSGSIWIDEHESRQISPQSLRSQMGVVPQECFLFSGTIFENITLFRPEYTLDQVIEVAKLAEAHAFIQSLPLSYNTKVGERGTNFSGGQRQRIAIARALLGEPRILVLDEATSSLDTESERRFQQNLARLSKDRTTFIIAHRLSTIRQADSILVLDRGIIVEQGTHEKLMDLKGLYYHLAQQQLDL